MKKNELSDFFVKKRVLADFFVPGKKDQVHPSGYVYSSLEDYQNDLVTLFEQVDDVELCSVVKFLTNEYADVIDVVPIDMVKM